MEEWTRSRTLEGTESSAVDGEGVSRGFTVIMVGGSAHSHRFPFQIVPRVMREELARTVKRLKCGVLQRGSRP
jgi:hypothetical protein